MKRDRMQQMSMEVTVGAFLFLVLFALGFFTIILSSENWFTDKHYYEVVFDDVMGLSAGDRVAVRGLEVGTISRLWLDPDGVHVLASLEKPLNLKEDYEVVILASSVLGGRYMQFGEGTLNAPPLTEGAVLQGERPVEIMAEASEIFNEIKNALVDGGILDNLKETMDQFRELSRKLNAGEGTLGRLMTDDEVYEDLRGLTSGLRSFSDEIQEGKGTLGLLMKDESLYKDLAATAENLKTISDRLEQGKGTIGKLLTEDDGLYNDLKDSIASLKEVSARLNAGEGTLGKLMTDDELYEEATLLLNEIRAAVDDFRETAPITSFSSIFFGAF